VGRLHQLRDVPVARSFRHRLVGLIGRRTNLLLHIPRCRSIHTAFMRSAIDVVFLDRAGRVVALHPRVAPWRVVFAPRMTDSVLELPPGDVESRAIAVGDAILFL